MPAMHRHFEDEIELLRSLLIRMGSLVDEQVETAIKALEESNLVQGSEIGRLWHQRSPPVRREAK